MTSSKTEPTNPPAGHSFAELVRVMRRLLAPDGCPWDREQTLDSLKPYLLEETYELLDAIETGTVDDHREELGDLMMQIVFQAELRMAEQAFDIDDVVRGIADKLIRRHPHVFGEAEPLDDAGEVLTRWAEIKAQERKEKQGHGVDRTLGGVPVSMPALSRAQQLTARAAQVGFDWPDVPSCRAKLAEEVAELDDAIAAGDAHQLEAEVGDLLLAAVNLSRKLGVDAESALRGSCQRFTRRFAYIEDALHEAGSSVREADLPTMDALWDEAKASEKAPA